MHVTPQADAPAASITIDWKQERSAADKRSLGERLGISAKTMEQYILSQTPIEVLGLSSRSSNALHRSKCHKVAEALSLSAHDLISFNLMGEISASEIVQKLHRYCDSSFEGCNENADTPQQTVLFWMLSSHAHPKSGLLLLDNQSGIEELRLSARPYNVLKRLGYHTVGQLRSIPVESFYEALLSMQYMGKKSVEEIMEKREAIHVPVTVSATSKEEIYVYLRVLEQGQSPMRWIVPKELFLTIRTTAWTSAGQLIKALEKLEGAEPSHDASFQAECLVVEPNFQETSLYRALSEMADNYRTWRYGTEITVPWMVEQISRLSYMMPLDDEHVRLFTKRADVLNALFCTKDALDRVQKCILLALRSANFGSTFDELMELIPEFLRRCDAPLDSLSMLLEQKRIFEKNGRYEIQYPNVMEYLNCYDDAKAAEIARMRLNGSTLEAIAMQYCITRERVRQIANKVFDEKRMPRVYEDRYAEFFQRYLITADDAMLLFEKVWTYPYLNQRYEQGTLPLDEALVDTNLPLSLRMKVQSCVYRGYLHVDGIMIPQTRGAIINHVIRIFCTKDTKVDDFFVVYQLFREEYGLKDSKFEIDARTFSNKMSGRRDVLWKYPSSLRYYPLSSYDFTELLDTLALNSYNDVELSTALFIRVYPELMARYDIRDEYELHNLLKKILPEDSTAINFSRMPMIVFGNANRDEQVFAMLLELAPVSNTGLAAAYEERYGVKAITVLANFFKCIEAYYDDGFYHIDYTTLTQSQLEVMRESLTDECYAISHIQQIYLRIFPKGRPSDVNAYSIRQMGFRPYSGYAVHLRHHDPTEYFSNLLTQHDHFSLDDLPPVVLTLNQFSATLNGLRHSYDIIEYEPRRYISLKRLETVDVKVADIQDYCMAVYDFCIEDTFFTIQSLRRQGFEHRLDGLGFQDWFYAGLLLQHLEIFSGQRMSNTRVLVRGQRKFSRADVIAEVVRLRGSLELDELVCILDEEYGIPVDREDLVQRIPESTLYYDRIMDKVYIDYDQYFEEV